MPASRFSPRRFRSCRQALAAAASLLMTALLVSVPAARAADVTLRIVDQHGAALNRAVVTIAAPGLPAAPPESTVHLMDQVNKRFVPDVLAINKGDYVRFPNSDDIRHHVYSFSVPLTFELPLYSGEPENPVHFREAGMVVVGCNIHDRMLGYIFIIEDAVHAVSANGEVSFTDLPDTALTLTIYHPDAAAPLSVVVQAAELAGPPRQYALDVQAANPEPDTSALTELEKKFLQLRHANH